MRKDIKVAIVCFNDGFANTVRPQKIKQYLENRECEVIVIDTMFIHRLSYRNGSPIIQSHPSISLENVGLYLVHITQQFLYTHASTQIKRWKYPLQEMEMRLRSIILTKILTKLQPQLTIVESQIDSLVLLGNIPGKKLFDCPTPLADEQFFGGEISTSQYRKLLAQELHIYSKTDYLSFHWHTYAEYIRGSTYKFAGKNILNLDFGCDEKNKHAKFSSKPKIVYMGYLGGSYINLDLLSTLTEKCPEIFVYGGPKPHDKYKLNYLGYAKPEILKKYQFGLITISKDKLRRNGFSAKHLEYISYGLPVLVPDWRTDASQIGGTILYNETNFLEKIAEYSKKSRWQEASAHAKSQAKRLCWNKQLVELNNILEIL